MEPLRYQNRIGEVDVPVLFSGWYDDEEIATPANFAAMTAAGRSGQRLLMGPWGHQVNAGRRLGEIDFGHQAVVDLDRIMTGFLNEKVRGQPLSEPAAPVQVFLMGADRWLELAAWPPPGSGERAWFLDTDGNANSRLAMAGWWKTRRARIRPPMSGCTTRAGGCPSSPPRPRLRSAAR